MFYHNTKYRFALPAMSPQSIAGGIIAASAMPKGQLLRRSLRKHPYLLHRFFDPQLYLSNLDPNVAERTVVNLASWPWFGRSLVPDYDSDEYKGIKAWKDTHREDLLEVWRRGIPNNSEEVERAVQHAILDQLKLGVDAIILPSPLTNTVNGNYESELMWLDAGLSLQERLKIRLPVYATVALSDNVLRAVNPVENRLLHLITNQLSARRKVDGIYVVVEQASEDSYVSTSRDTLFSILVLVDDIVRGARRRAIVNYMGIFGVVASAAGASVWSSGYYLSQRRFRLPDYEERVALAYPRFFSTPLAGDIGIQADLENIFRCPVGDRVITETVASRNLLDALRDGRSPEDVPEWEYAQTNLSAATAHYLEACVRLDTIVSGLETERKLDWIQRWLSSGVELSRTLQAVATQPTYKTELHHQRVWLEAFESWRSYAGV